MRVVYFSPVHLHSFWQRPHWMAASLLRHGVDRLLWLEPYATRLPRLSDLRRPSDRPREMGTTAPLRLDRMAVRALPIEPLLAGRAANQLLFFEDILARIERWVGGEPYVIGVGKPSPLALTALDRAAGRDNYAGSFFDAMDRYGAFHKGASREAMSDWESQLLRKVDYVQASAPRLRECLVQRRPEVALALNGFDAASIERAQRASAHLPQHAHPVFGYVGTIGSWFDWAWVRQFAAVLADRAPTAEIHLIGPVFHPAGGPLPASIKLLDTMSNADALARAAQFTAGLIPFQRNELTDCVDPVKYYEYRALGRPVISTPFGHLSERQDPGLAIVGAERDALAAAIDRSLTVRALPQLQKDCDWDSRFAPLSRWIGARSAARLPAGELAVAVSL